MGHTRPETTEVIQQRLCSVEKNANDEDNTTTEEMWDSGVYTLRQIHGVPTKFLVDTGAAVSILSRKTYLKIPQNKRPTCQETDIVVRGVSGNPLALTGVAKIPVVFQSELFVHDFLIAEIPLDAILGQDMLMKNQGRLDLGRMILRMKGTDLSCWTQGEEHISCRVIVQEKTKIPYGAEKIVPISISNAGALTEVGFVQPSPEVIESKQVMMVRGIVPTQMDVAYVRVLNLGDDDLELHPNQCLGICEPYVDEPTVSYTNTACAAVTATNGETQDLPEHIQKLFTDSSDQLTDEECEKLRSLLIEYSQVFAKDKKDLGSCPYIKHKINTGTALPIRKPPRRLPLGKREIEQKEIHSMLEKGIIQPSISPWSAPIVLVTKKDGSTRFCVDEDKGDELPIHSLQQATVGQQGSGSM